MKILIIENGYNDLCKSRIPLGNYLKKKGKKIYYSCPNPDINNNNFILSLPMNRSSLDLITKFKSILKLVLFENQNNIDVIYSFRLIPNFYNYCSSFLNQNKKRIVVITGLGYSFSSKKIKYQIYSFLIKIFYKLVSKRLFIISQNNTDLYELGIKNGMVIKGSGLKSKNKISKYNKNQLTMIFVGRLLKSKGLYEAINIFKKVKNQNFFYKKKLIIVGDIDKKNPDSITEKELRILKKIDGIDFIGYQKNTEIYYLKSNILLFPSEYREGVPRVIIEALSYGLTIITKNRPGCRGTINDNGFLIDNEKDEVVNYLNNLSVDDIKENSKKSLKLFNKDYSDKVIYNQYHGALKLL